MNIPLVVRRSELPDRRIVMGAHAGVGDWYKTALLNTLIALRPRVCLEIGTHYGGTTEVFVEYFNSYMSNGVLVTADIKRFKIFDDPTTIQVIVFPHSHDVISRHFVTQEELLGHSEDSVDVNTSILRGCLDELSQNAFDFAFVDGDHARDSVLKDLDIVKRLSTDPHYALLDDVKDDLHEVSTLWRETLTQHFEYYDFGDWPIFCGVGLLWGY